MIRGRLRKNSHEHNLQWALKIGAPPGADGDVWGDLFYAEDLAEALRRRGQLAYVDGHGERLRPGDRPDDVVVNLRGYYQEPVDPQAVNLLWVISHPDWVTDEELQSGYDVIYAASVEWSARKSEAIGVKILPLLQATNPSRFRPGVVEPDVATEVLFLGKSRDIFRPIVRDTIAVGGALTIFGDRWEQFVPAHYVRAEFLGNERVPGAYRSAGIVLNDHWEDMRREGFLSNRLFDAVACGARVISDDTAGLTELFGGSVKEYSSPTELSALLRDAEAWPSVETLESNARMVAAEHSFEQRADTMIRAVRERLGLDQRASSRRR